MHKTAFLHFIWITYENDKSFRQCGEQRPSLHLKVAALRLALLNYRNIRLNFSLPAFSEFWRIWEKMLYKTNQTHLNWGLPERNCLCSNFCFWKFRLFEFIFTVITRLLSFFAKFKIRRKKTILITKQFVWMTNH